MPKLLGEEKKDFQVEEKEEFVFRVKLVFEKSFLKRTKKRKREREKTG